MLFGPVQWLIPVIPILWEVEVEVGGISWETQQDPCLFFFFLIICIFLVLQSQGMLLHHQLSMWIVAMPLRKPNIFYFVLIPSTWGERPISSYIKMKLVFLVDTWTHSKMTPFVKHDYTQGFHICSQVPHNDVSVNDRPHIWLWSQKIIKCSWKIPIL